MIEDTLVLSILAFVTTYVFLKSWIVSARKKGIFGIDVHKLNKPKITDAGGTIFLLTITFSLLIYGLWLTLQKTPDFRFFAILSSVLLAGLLGLTDYLIGIKWRNKILLPLIISIPLMIARVGHTGMDLPIVGHVDLGNLYTFLIVPLAVIGSVNMVNMLAGYNGLEAGLGAVNAFWFLIVSYLLGDNLLVLMSALLLSVLLAFLKFNWYPAKVFIGDVGTFVIGAVLVSIAIIGNMEKFALGLFSLYFLNFLLFVYWQIARKPFKKFADIGRDGYIKPPNPYTLYWIFPYYFRLKEETIVKILLVLQFLVGLISFLLFVKI